MEDGSAGLGGQRIHFDLGSGGDQQTCDATTDEGGLATCTLDSVNQPLGSSAYVASFAGSDRDRPSSAANSLTVQAATTLTIVGDVASAYDDTARLSAALVDSSLGSGIEGAQIDLSAGSGSCTATTDSSGVGSCSVLVTDAPGAYATDASFEGNALYLFSTAEGPFGAMREDTYIVPDTQLGFVAGGPLTVGAVVQEDGSGALLNASVSFVLGSGNSQVMCIGVSDASGFASCVVQTTPDMTGKQTIAMTFAGDDRYLAAANAQTVNGLSNTGWLAVAIDNLDTGGSSFTSGVFHFAYTCGSMSGAVSIPYPAPGFAVIRNVPDGTACTVAQTDSPSPPSGYDWAAPNLTGTPTTIAVGLTSVVGASEALIPQTGTLSVEEKLADGGSGFAGTFSIALRCTDGFVGTLSLVPNSSQAIGGVLNGSSCVVTEPTLPTAPEGYSWGATSYTPADGTVTIVKNQTVSVRVSDSLSPVQSDDAPPMVVVTAPTAPGGQSGFFTASQTPVAVSVAASDPSGLASVACTDGPQGVVPTPNLSGNPVSYAGVLSLGADGVHNIVCVATDALGNGPGAAEGSSNAATVLIDGTAPAISGTSSPHANGNGWNETDVTVTFTCSDVTSGVQSCTPPATLSGDGKNQSVHGTAVDLAGNSTSTTVEGINIDKTDPTLAGTPTTSPNQAGWYRDDVAIHWSASDQGSGVDPATIPGDSIITSEGTNLKAVASVSDLAGNTGTGESAAVKIDRSPPVTKASAPSGWQKNGVVVTFSAKDNLSGVDKIYYSVDGGPTQTGGSVAINDEGVHTISFWSTDVAGNVEDANDVQVLIDKSAPTLTHVLVPVPNTHGWDNSPVTVTFTCKDSFSGITFCTGPQIVSTDGAGQTVTGEADDQAGNVTYDNALVSIDQTPPTITAAASPSANGKGWYNGPVTISYTCGDELSGISSCSPPKVVSTEGANQSVTGTATDAAGNSSGVTVKPINIDTTPPTAAVTGVANGGIYPVGSVTPACRTTDGLSGVDTAASLSLTGGTGGLGTITATCSGATDKAGNLGPSVSVTYTVFAYLGSGSFVIGDGNASVGASVTYWGAQWAKLNTLSGGSAPSAFKGFADTPSPAPPVCGGAFTTDPGGSSQPPKTVPAYIGVIVSSKITQPSRISGNVVKIVVVRTNAGYGPDPGHPGTGTVVSLACG